MEKSGLASKTSMYVHMFPLDSKITPPKPLPFMNGENQYNIKCSIIIMVLFSIEYANKYDQIR